MPHIAGGNKNVKFSVNPYKCDLSWVYNKIEGVLGKFTFLIFFLLFLLLHLLSSQKKKKTPALTINFDVCVDDLAF